MCTHWHSDGTIHSLCIRLHSAPCAAHCSTGGRSGSTPQPTDGTKPNRLRCITLAVQSRPLSHPAPLSVVWECNGKIQTNTNKKKECRRVKVAFAACQQYCPPPDAPCMRGGRRRYATARMSHNGRYGCYELLKPQELQKISSHNLVNTITIN